MQDAPVTEASGSLERLYREQGARLWKSLFAFSGDAEIASDALAEAFAQALARGEAISRPDAWVWTAAFKIAAGQLKARRRPALSVQERSYELPPSSVDIVEALSKLPPKQRMAIVLHDYADRPISEVARAIGASSATVYVHLSQGRRRLRALLEDVDE